MKNLIIIVTLSTMAIGCTTQSKIQPPYDYNGALSELHRAGNADTRPGIPGAASTDMNTPERLTSRTCTSTPIYNIYGQFVRYSVNCF